MRRIPLFYKTSERNVELKISSRSDKLGNVLFFVEFGDDYAAFHHLSSALDYIQTNFKED